MRQERKRQKEREKEQERGEIKGEKEIKIREERCIDLGSSLDYRIEPYARHNRYAVSIHAENGDPVLQRHIFYAKQKRSRVKKKKNTVCNLSSRLVTAFPFSPPSGSRAT